MHIDPGPRYRGVAAYGRDNASICLSRRGRDSASGSKPSPVEPAAVLDAASSIETGLDEQP